MHAHLAGLNRAAGILYLRFTEKFDRPASITSWVTSLSVSLTLGVGKLVTMMYSRTSAEIYVSAKNAAASAVGLFKFIKIQKHGLNVNT